MMNQEGFDFRSLSIDLDSPGAFSELLREIDSENINILVHNVGGNLNLTNPLGTSSEFMQVVAHNLAISIDLNSHLIPRMQDSGWGRVCHISSISALENQGPPSYSAAKAAINAYVRGVGRYVARDGVVVTSVMPGAIFTEGGYWDQVSRERPEHLNKFLTERVAIGRLGDVAEVSNLICYLVSDANTFMAGSAILIDGGQGRVIEFS